MLQTYFSVIWIKFEFEFELKEDTFYEMKIQMKNLAPPDFLLNICMGNLMLKYIFETGRTNIWHMNQVYLSAE